MSKVILSMSGGSTKGIGELGMMRNLLYNGLDPTDFAGVSIGAALSLVGAVSYVNPRVLESATHMMINMTPSVAFSKSPVTKRGGLSLYAIKRIAHCLLPTKHNPSSIGKMDNFKKSLAKIISEEDFNKWSRGNYPNCWVGAVCVNANSKVLKNIKHVTYNEALDWVTASSSIAIATTPVKIGNLHYIDGGHKFHNPASELIGKHMNGEDVDLLVSLYTRPQNDSKDMMSGVNGLFDMAAVVIDSFVSEISKNDEEQENMLADIYGFEIRQLFLPRVLKHLYDMDTARLIDLYRQGLSIGNIKI
jgi:predicted acylesterase/phospholipase RssA